MGCNTLLNQTERLKQFMNILIKDILTVLPDSTEICSVYISGDKIVSVQKGSDNSVEPKDFKADKTINGTDKLLMPGFINAHTHAPMTILRNCADDLLFNDWLFSKILPLEEKLTGEDCYWGTMLSMIEMISTGTTSFIDMYYFLDDMARAVDEAGMRAVLSRGLISDSNDPSVGESRLHEAFEIMDRWKSNSHIDFMLAPHAPYTCDFGYLQEVAQEAKSRDLRIKSHLSEGPVETVTIKDKYDCTPTELYEKAGILSDKILVAHCVQVTDNDIEILAKHNVNIVTNPVSNLKLANGIAPVPKMLKAGINVALGTDGAASNNSLNMFRELAFLALVHKGVNRDAVAVTASDAFTIATKNGAKVMGRDDLGEIKAGNTADLVLLDLNCPNMQPLNNPRSSLAYSANGSEVSTVIVGGRILMENKEFTTIDTEKVYYNISKICERIGIQ